MYKKIYFGSFGFLISANVTAILKNTNDAPHWWAIYTDIDFQFENAHLKNKNR